MKDVKQNKLNYMKIRSGFVSNSSSSSFVCNVCGTVESGMDMSASDFDMETCCNGHTFCLDHANDLPETTPQMLRDSITKQINGCNWTEVKRKTEKLKELSEITDDELDDFYQDNYSDDGVSEC